jgi:serine protease Do
MIGLAIIVAIGVVGRPYAADLQVPVSREQVRLSYAPIVKRAAPAVVNIYSRKEVRTRGFTPLFDDPFFRRFFGDNFRFGGPRSRIQNSLGSGVIVDSHGTIVTNHHVVAGADEITVVLPDRREFEAQFLGSDERADLAVLKIDVGDEKLPFLELDDSDEVEVGDLVLAIGNPFGVGQTVTSGIVSAQARTQVGINDLNFFIQTDAAINPGNSGGALVDMEGRLIGINSAIYSKSGGSMGIGFAVPSNMVRTVLAGFAQGGQVVRPWLGAWGQQVTAEIAHSLGMKRPVGVLIDEVYAGGPADRAGIRVGDVVLSVKERPVEDPESLDYRIATASLGSTVAVELLRRGEKRTASLKIEAPPEEPPRETTQLGGRHPLAGATVANMSPALAEELGEDRYRPGVAILDLESASPAMRLGFRIGDRILKVNGETVTSVAALKKMTARQRNGWRIVFRRGGKTLNLVIGG